MSRTVHPRWRGEHDLDSTKIYPGAGSSPLARGTLEWHAPGRQNMRFIPAGAGNT